MEFTLALEFTFSSQLFQHILKLFQPQVLKRCFCWYSQYWLWSRLIPFVFYTDIFIRYYEKVPECLLLCVFLCES